MEFVFIQSVKRELMNKQCDSLLPVHHGASLRIYRFIEPLTYRAIDRIGSFSLCTSSGRFIISVARGILRSVRRVETPTVW